MQDIQRVLFISHNGLTEPLGRRQVLPYLVGLAARGWRITVLSFEKIQTATPEAVAGVEQITREAKILWNPLRYHNRPPIAATAYDIIRGFHHARLLARDIALIHARSTVPALMASLLSKRFCKPWIFDVRGLLAEEYVDAGHWPRSGVRHRLTAAIEASLLRSADGRVTLTRKVLNRLPVSDGRGLGRPTMVIPCSVDLAVIPTGGRLAPASSEGSWAGGEPVLVYSGSLGSWYRIGEMLDFFEQHDSGSTGFASAAHAPGFPGENELRTRELVGLVVAKTVEPDEVPRYLAAADAGICFLGRHPSKDASSPTKFGEYLATGLPVVTNDWIGDALDLAGERAWILVHASTAEAYEQAALGLARLLDEPDATPLAAARSPLANSLETAVERYHDVYLKVLRL